MEKQNAAEGHPILQIGERVRREGLVVLDNVTTQPLDGEPYISPYAMIALCQQGSAKSEYDMTPVEFNPRDMNVLRVGHVVRAKETSSDYRACFIVMSEAFFEKFRNLTSPSLNIRHSYYDQPLSLHLTDNQYRQMINIFNLLKMVSTEGRHYREELLLGILHIIFMLCYEFSSVSDAPRPDTHPSYSVRFKEAVVEHYQESREVGFYARMFNLSPKYFSTLIKQEIGISASEWIDRYMVLQSKSVLIHRNDLNIQQISDLLGFSEQATFSRFFKKQTGLSPTEFRSRNLL